MNLRSQLFLWIATLVTIAIVGVSGMTVITERRLLKSELDQHAVQMAERLAHVCEESLYQNDLVFYNYFKTLNVERGFLGATFLDSTGKIRVHSNPHLIGAYLSSPREKDALRSSSLYIQRYRDASTEILDLASPVTFAGERVGTARIFFSENVLNEFLAQATRVLIWRIGTIALIVLLLAYLGAFLLSRLFIRPIREIVEGMKKISSGDLAPIALKKRKDELGWMGEELNSTVVKLKELDEMKRDFVASVTHELHSPLAAIESLVALLLDNTKEAVTLKQRNFLITVQNNAVRLTRLIGDLLATARLEAKKEKFDLHRIDIRRCLQDVYRLYFAQTKQQGTEFKLTMPGEPVFATVDEDKLLQVLNNLVSNAFKFMKKGVVDMTLITGNGEASITVSDTGPGIPEAERKNLFKKFYRVKSETKVPGTGLGLFIAKEFIEGQGGIIAVEPNSPVGAKFILRLPLS